MVTPLRTRGLLEIPSLFNNYLHSSFVYFETFWTFHGWLLILCTFEFCRPPIHGSNHSLCLRPTIISIEKFWGYEDWGPLKSTKIDIDPYLLFLLRAPMSFTHVKMAHPKIHCKLFHICKWIRCIHISNFHRNMAPMTN